MSAVWDEDDTQSLLAMYREGMKTTAIGKALGRTKNAVCGQLKRLRDRGEQLPWRSLRFGQPGVVNPKVRTVKIPAKVSIVKRQASFKIDTEARKSARSLDTKVHVLNVKPGQCRYIGENIFHCCGRETSGGSWCDAHKHVVFEGKKAA